MPKRTLEGRVVSSKTAKTIVVEIVRKKKHPLYHKVIAYTRKFMAHDEAGQAKDGDLVRIEECRPISKRKTWMLKDVLEKAV